ncbi:MAG: hypothetical protein HETSPECPRED_005984 [Heterodermia speciosa]|uniref:AB hydrolase-1 domain-containing protein n=1 Tax=Heterodermia speciosa TaxID=116794 RepID=A0A8H3EHW1_9LECA|nr:MAG: hypothetical protein HETSPECPRED_005984 [Heterodermia speciosa]
MSNHTHHHHPPTYHNLTVSDGTTIAYTLAGNPSSPPLLLLHGFPSSSHQYRNLIPLLSPTHHIIAPSLPGFGLTSTPPHYPFTFATLTSTLNLFLTALHLSKYAVYIFDYGAPIALRLALQNPSALTAIISQNGNAYTQGFGHPFWDPIFATWSSGNSPATREALRAGAMTLSFTRLQYEAGVPASDLPLIDPVTYNLDYEQNIAPPERQEAQLDLLYDYRTNVDLYPEFHAYFRESQVPLLAIWGKGDPAFVPAGARAFGEDLKGAEIRFVDAGHFALETKGGEIAREVVGFLGRVGW